MDPLTHGMIGLAISTFSGSPVDLSNPVSIGCALGAMSPDIDTVVRLFKNDYVYLKHHRGKSHSIPSLAALSIGITFGLGLMFPGMNILSVLLWTFIGALSHTIFDILNSYGAMLFKKKMKANLLTLYDPVITGLGLYMIFTRRVTSLSLNIVLVIFLTYLFLRATMSQNARRDLNKIYGENFEVVKIDILPSLMAFYKWDYIVKTKTHTIVGKYNQLNKKIKEIKVFEQHREEMVDLFNNTKVGAYFNDFSPNLHVIHDENDDKIVLRAIDLRYHMKDNFMHHATVEYCKNTSNIKSVFHPYSLQKSIEVAEEAV